jgi:sulfhydrogenase subunit alpha
MYLTGPLARYNLSGSRLTPLARQAASEAGLGRRCTNPFQSIVVRAVEITHACDEALSIIASYEQPDRPAIPVGLDARIVPPTSQNQRAIEQDLRAVVERHASLSDEDLRLRCEQAIRNHDPCISCATHFLQLTVDRG